MPEILDQLHRPLRDLRISVIDRCNFRCGYCMPNDKKYQFMPLKSLLTFEQILNVVKSVYPLGVRKIRLTGGEPLLRTDCASLVAKIKEKFPSLEVAMTTNGYLLKKHARSLKEAGLDRLTVSLDTIDANLFKQFSGVGASITPVLEGIDLCRSLGFENIKVNMVAQKPLGKEKIIDACAYFRSINVQLRLIEFMDVGNTNQWAAEDVISQKQILSWIHEHYPIEAIDKKDPSLVANEYRYLDGQGSLGVIASISQPFCQQCTRLRLSANGTLYGCLFASEGYDVKPILTSESGGEILQEAIASFWKQRQDRYSMLRSKQSKRHAAEKVEMFRMGG